MTTSTLDAAIGDVERILLDTSALVAYHSRAEAVHPLAEHLLRRVADADDRLHAYVSVITAAELLIRPLRASTERFTFMHTFLTQFPHLSLLPMDLTVAVQAATIRSATGLRLPDAAIVASGLLAGCEAIVCNDEQWKRKLAPLFPDFRWIYLGEHLLAGGSLK